MTGKDLIVQPDAKALSRPSERCSGSHNLIIRVSTSGTRRVTITFPHRAFAQQFESQILKVKGLNPLDIFSRDKRNHAKVNLLLKEESFEVQVSPSGINLIFDKADRAQVWKTTSKIWKEIRSNEIHLRYTWTDKELEKAMGMNTVQVQVPAEHRNDKSPRK